MALNSPRFKWNSRLQAAFRNSPVMRTGDSGHAVRLIQQSLIDLGYPMPITVQKYQSPDGIFGGETKSAVMRYQSANGLSADGIIGTGTMTKLDAALPGAGPNLPALPARSRYVVPGLVVHLQQGPTNLCWAFSYTMMLSWKLQQSISVRDAVADVGALWLNLFDQNRGLPHSQTTNFYRAAGMQVEPLMCFPVSEWADMLRRHGPFAMHGLAHDLTRGHVKVIYGVQGDGNLRSTTILLADPATNRKYGESLERFLAKYEGGAGQAERTTQLGHF